MSYGKRFNHRVSFVISRGSLQSALKVDVGDIHGATEPSVLYDYCSRLCMGLS